jgi:hypothetical protein
MHVMFLCNELGIEQCRSMTTSRSYREIREPREVRLKVHRDHYNSMLRRTSMPCVEGFLCEETQPYCNSSLRGGCKGCVCESCQQREQVDSVQLHQSVAHVAFLYQQFCVECAARMHYNHNIPDALNPSNCSIVYSLLKHTRLHAHIHEHLNLCGLPHSQHIVAILQPVDRYN